MNKGKIFVVLVAVGLAVGIAVIWATGSDVHDRRIKAYIAASDKCAQILEEEASKPVEKRDLARMEEARIAFGEAFKTNMSDHYSSDEVAKNPAFDAAYARNQTQSVRASERLDKALKATNPEYAKQMEHKKKELEAKMKQWEATRK